MAIVNAVDMFLDAMPERGKVLGSDSYARLMKGLDELVGIYNDLMDESRGAAVVFNDNKAEVLGHAAEFNHENSYGHDLLHSFWYAGKKSYTRISKKMSTEKNFRVSKCKKYFQTHILKFKPGNVAVSVHMSTMQLHQDRQATEKYMKFILTETLKKFFRKK